MSPAEGCWGAAEGAGMGSALAGSAPWGDEPAGGLLPELSMPLPGAVPGELFGAALGAAEGGPEGAPDAPPAGLPCGRLLRMPLVVCCWLWMPPRAFSMWSMRAFSSSMEPLRDWTWPWRCCLLGAW